MNITESGLEIKRLEEEYSKNMELKSKILKELTNHILASIQHSGDFIADFFHNLSQVKKIVDQISSSEGKSAMYYEYQKCLKDRLLNSSSKQVPRPKAKQDIPDTSDDFFEETGVVKQNLASILNNEEELLGRANPKYYSKSSKELKIREIKIRVDLSKDVEKFTNFYNQLKCKLINNIDSIKKELNKQSDNNYNSYISPSYHAKELLDDAILTYLIDNYRGNYTVFVDSLLRDILRGDDFDVIKYITPKEYESQTNPRELVINLTKHSSDDRINAAMRSAIIGTSELMSCSLEYFESGRFCQVFPNKNNNVEVLI